MQPTQKRLSRVFRDSRFSFFFRSLLDRRDRNILYKVFDTGSFGEFAPDLESIIRIRGIILRNLHGFLHRDLAVARRAVRLVGKRMIRKPRIFGRSVNKVTADDGIRKFLAEHILQRIQLVGNLIGGSGNKLHFYV